MNKNVVKALHLGISNQLDAITTTTRSSTIQHGIKEEKNEDIK